MYVSVIMPYYKNRKYVKKSILSVLNQSFKNLELIIIFDDTNNEDLKFLNSFKKIDKRIKIIKNKKNIGAGLSRNSGIQVSKGKYISFLDSDDFWHKNKLKTQINIMKKKKINISHTSYNIVDVKNKYLSHRTAHNLRYNDLIHSCNVGLSTVVINKKILNKNMRFPNLKTKEDYVLWLKLSKRSHKFYGIDKKLVSWRYTPNSLSKSTLQKIKDSIAVYYKFEKMNFLKSIIFTFILSLNYLKKK